MVKVLNMVCHDRHLPKNVVDQGNNKFNGQPWWPIAADHGGPWSTMVNHGQLLGTWLTIVNFCHDRPWCSTIVGDGGQLP